MICLPIFNYDWIDRNEIKFGLWMALHHSHHMGVRWGLRQVRYSLRIIWRGLI